MRKKLLGLLATAAAALGLAAPAEAVTNGQPDNGAHPMVGLLVFYDGAGSPTHRCSGTMISATKVLTAGHCTFDTGSAQIWFDEDMQNHPGYPFEGGFTGSTHTYPVFSGALTLPETGDVGVVVLDSAPGVGAASLAPVGALDSLATRRGRQNTRFDVVGYGLQDIKPVEIANRVRLKASVRLINLRSALTDGYNIHATGAPGTGGGTCFGDSGGPVFQEGSFNIVAVNSFVFNSNCAGSGAGYRVDRGEVQNWINSI